MTKVDPVGTTVACRDCENLILEPNTMVDDLGNPIWHQMTCKKQPQPLRINPYTGDRDPLEYGHCRDLNIDGVCGSYSEPGSTKSSLGSVSKFLARFDIELEGEPEPIPDYVVAATLRPVEEPKLLNAATGGSDDVADIKRRNDAKSAELNDLKGWLAAFKIDRVKGAAEATRADAADLKSDNMAARVIPALILVAVLIRWVFW